MNPLTITTLTLAAAISYLTLFPATSLAADAARVAGDLKVGGIHFSTDGSVVRKLSDLTSPWTIYNLDIYFLGGNVGIGTASPSTTLDVNGTVRATQSSGTGPAIRGLTSGSTNTTGSFTYSGNGSGDSGGHAGYFENTNAANTKSTLYAVNNGLGVAGSFENTNAANSKATLYATTNGLGPAIRGLTTGSTNTTGSFTYAGDGSGDSGGHAGYFESTNTANTKSTLYAVNSGLGVTGSFENTNPTNNKATLYATTNGSGAAIYGYQTGTARAGSFTINNQNSSASALYATTNGTGYAAYFDGNIYVNGVINKSATTFKIDHPLDPKNKYLYHSAVESPDMMNIYNGNVVTDAQGYATVTLPEWFEALNREFRYQLTILDDNNSQDFVQAKVVQKIADNYFTIRSSKPGTEVSWQVTGVRRDPYAEKHRIQVEMKKTAAEKGTCIYPEACIK